MKGRENLQRGAQTPHLKKVMIFQWNSIESLHYLHKVYEIFSLQLHGEIGIRIVYSLFKISTNLNSRFVIKTAKVLLLYGKKIQLWFIIYS